MSMLIGVRRALLPGIRRVSYLLRDRFHTPRAAGSVDGTAAEPGPGTRAVSVDTGTALSIAGGVATATATGIGDPILHYGQFTRVAGRIFAADAVVFGTARAYFGLHSVNDGVPTSAAFRLFADLNTLYAYHDGTAPIVGTFTSAISYRLWIVSRAATSCAYFFVEGGTEYLTPILVWISGANIAESLYLMCAWRVAGLSTFDNVRVPDAIWLPTPLVYDTFTRANGAIGASETVGPDSQTTLARAWNNRVGTTQIAGNTASASALVGGIAIATVDTGSVDTIVTAEATRAAGNVGIVLRYVDTANYIYAIHDGTNAKLVKRVADVEADVISAVTAYAAGAEIRVIPHGTSFRLFYNDAKIGATSAIADAGLQTGTEQGLYSSNTGNSQDDFAVFPRGTGNEYNGLKGF